MKSLLLIKASLKMVSQKINREHYKIKDHQTTVFSLFLSKRVQPFSGYKSLF